MQRFFEFILEYEDMYQDKTIILKGLTVGTNYSAAMDNLMTCYGGNEISSVKLVGHEPQDGAIFETHEIIRDDEGNETLSPGYDALHTKLIDFAKE